MTLYNKALFDSVLSSIYVEPNDSIDYYSYSFSEFLHNMYHTRNGNMNIQMKITIENTEEKELLLVSH